MHSITGYEPNHSGSNVNAGSASSGLNLAPPVMSSTIAIAGGNPLAAEQQPLPPTPERERELTQEVDQLRYYLEQAVSMGRQQHHDFRNAAEEFEVRAQDAASLQTANAEIKADRKLQNAMREARQTFSAESRQMAGLNAKMQNLEVEANQFVDHQKMVLINEARVEIERQKEQVVSQSRHEMRNEKEKIANIESSFADAYQNVQVQAHNALVEQNQQAQCEVSKIQAEAADLQQKLLDQ